MAIVKLVGENYPCKGDVVKLMYYISNPDKCIHEICGERNIISSICYNARMISEQFLAVQQGQRFNRRVYHLVISFDTEVDNPNRGLVLKVGQTIANMYSDYQSVFTVHEDLVKNNVHIHMVFNNCPIFSGKKKLTEVLNLMHVRKVVDLMIDRHLGIPQ